MRAPVVGAKRKPRGPPAMRITIPRKSPLAATLTGPAATPSRPSGSPPGAAAHVQEALRHTLVRAGGTRSGGDVRAGFAVVDLSHAALCLGEPLLVGLAEPGQRHRAHHRQ